MKKHGEEDGSSVELRAVESDQTAAAPSPPMVGGGGAEKRKNSLTDSPAKRACDRNCEGVLVQAGTHSAQSCSLAMIQRSHVDEGKPGDAMRHP